MREGDAGKLLIIKDLLGGGEVKNYNSDFQIKSIYWEFCERLTINKERRRNMMKKKMFVWMLSFVLVLSMFSLTVAQQAGPPPVVKEMVAKAKAAIKVVSAADVKAAIDKKEEAVILDVRDPNEYAAGHLPGAINVSRGTLELGIWGKVADQNAKIYVYCQIAVRSALATKTLNDLGYKNAVMMDAQFKEWIEAGYPVER